MEALFVGLSFLPNVPLRQFGTMKSKNAQMNVGKRKCHKPWNNRKFFVPPVRIANSPLTLAATANVSPSTNTKRSFACWPR